MRLSANGIRATPAERAKPLPRDLREMPRSGETGLGTLSDCVKRAAEIPGNLLVKTNGNHRQRASFGLDYNHRTGAHASIGRIKEIDQPICPLIPPNPSCRNAPSLEGAKLIVCENHDTITSLSAACYVWATGNHLIFKTVPGKDNSCISR